MSLLKALQANRFAKLNTPLARKDVISLQKDLFRHNFCALPESFLDILYESNGISFNTADIFGLYPDNIAFRDIVAENTRLESDNNILVLGASDTDFLVYNSQNNVYQILDRDDLEVLEEYPEKNVWEAVSIFLKVYDV